MIICLFATFHHSFIYVVGFFNHHSWFGSSFHWGLCLQRKLAVFLVGHCYFWWMKSCDFLKAIAKFTLNLVGQDSPKELKSPKRPLWHKERQWGVAGFWVCTGHLHSTRAVCRLLLLRHWAPSLHQELCLGWKTAQLHTHLHYEAGFFSVLREKWESTRIFHRWDIF